MPTADPALPADAARARIRADLDLIDSAHARIRSICTDLVGNAFRIEVAERLESQQRTNRGLSYRMFGEIADPVDGPDDPALPTEVKVRDLLWARLRVTRGEIQRRFRVAARIRPRRTLTGPSLPAELPELGAAVEAGDVGEDHIAAVTKALDDLPVAVSAADRDEAERKLVGYATKQDAKFVTAIGYKIADCLNPDGNFSDEDRAKQRSLVLGRQRPDGMSRISGFLDPEARAYLEAVTAAVRPGHRLPDAPAGPAADERDTRSSAQRCHDALKLTLRHGISSGELGTHRGVPVTVIVTTTLSELDRAARATCDCSIRMPAPARTGGGSRLPMRDLIRMAGNAIHYLAVFDDHSARPLYLGRSKRIATTDQRIICHARDRGCTRPDCLVSGYRCEVHHAVAWARGGTTDADKLFFGCPPDHASETRGDYTTTVTDKGRLAWSDGAGPPRINHIHHPEGLLHSEDP
ncbi:HNH endonuclease signature motif containing protein [Mycobacterium sp.]|uniref:HNH endonuclease signature motif containing protein n=1 Tax=Mycobacterium sp. TaxID=1785 RepID=UPI003D6A9ECC